MAFVITQSLVSDTGMKFEPLYMQSYDRRTHQATWGSQKPSALKFDNRQDAQQVLNWFWIMHHPEIKEGSHEAHRHEYDMEET